MSDPIMFPQLPKWTIIWHGETFEASSAYEVLAQIGARSYAPLDHKFPKRGIAYRLFVQFRILIDDELPDEQFLYRLAEFGIITLNVSGAMPDDLLQQAVDFSQAWYGEFDPKKNN